MTETPTENEGVILEPGDPGYVEPVQGGYADPADRPPDEPVIGTLGEVAGPPGEDLTHQRLPGESDAEYAARTRGVVVDSTSPSDIVPNTPQTTMGVRVQVEGTDPPVYVGVPPEALEEPELPPEEDLPPEGETESVEDTPEEEPPVEEAPVGEAKT